MLNVVITDGRHDLDITFFKAWGHERALVPGCARHLRGHGRHLQPAAPADPPRLHDARRLRRRGAQGPHPRSTARSASCTRGPSPRACARVLDVLDEVPDALPADVRGGARLVSRTEALRGIHTPDSMAEVEDGPAAAALRGGVRPPGDAGAAAAHGSRPGRRPRDRRGRAGCSRPSTRGCPSRSPPGSARSARGSPTRWAATCRCTGCSRARSARARRWSRCGPCSQRSMPVGRPRCSPPPRCSLRSTTARSPRCSATSPRAACWAARSTRPGSPCSPAASRPPSAAGRCSTSHRRRGHRRRHARAAAGDRRLLRPRPRRRRRAAPFRRRAAGRAARQGQPCRRTCSS